MVVYNFKKIAPIPSAADMIDIVLMRTQRKTPTVVHPGYAIGRIRSFYMRKVKFTQQTVDEKFDAMLTDFPKLDDIHPFYSDLMNILYDRDHYKLALGQVNTARNMIQGISRDYLRLLKYGDSLFRCKQLKRAALGRMCTVVKKLRAALGYLEEVRKHISRLPALDPNTRTLLLTGYPNVGKSSFMNKVTKADVEVQPYAFTTKALYVGHMDHRFLRWQVVDTPGILDRPLEERNTIEMQAITALAHLQCCVLYFLDISEQCGYPMEQQLKLFESIKPLFANKQVIMVANKTDVIKYEQLAPHTRAAIEACARGHGVEVVPCSNISEENISILKAKACDQLLQARVDAKLASGRLRDDVMSRITVAQPKPRDNVIREAFIPPSAASSMSMSMSMSAAAEGGGGSRVLERDLMKANGGAGVYSCDYRKFYVDMDDEWKYDAIPEFMDGKNVMDFFDADIEEKLRMLEDEEAQLEASGAYAAEEECGEELQEDELTIYEAIKEKQNLSKMESRLKGSNNKPRDMKNRSMSREDVKDRLEHVGLASNAVISSLEERGRRRDRSRSIEREKSQERSASRSASRNPGAHSSRSTRSRSATRGPRDGSVPKEKEIEVHKKGNRIMERHLFKYAKRSESDREHYPKLVKHLNSGKRQGQKTSTIGR